MHARRSWVRISRVGVLLGGVLALWPPSSVFAIGGMADSVIIIDDMTDLYRWPREKAEWNRVVIELKTQVRKQEDILGRMGTVERVAPRQASAVASVRDAAAAALSLETAKQAQERGKELYGIKKRTKKSKLASNRVEASFQVLGSQQARAAERYEGQAMLEALQERYATALENQDKVAQKELTAQRDLLDKLKNARTQAELQSLNAALSASRQYLELARQKTEQAREECELFHAELQLESERKRSADQEWSEAFINKLRLRALTSLHAQKGENS